MTPARVKNVTSTGTICSDESMTGSLNNILFDDGRKTTPLNDVCDQLFLVTRDSGNDRFVRYAVLLALSAVIATGGIIVDSTATVIGAMIVAPLATPILAVGLAITTVRPRQVITSGIILAISVAFVVFIGIALNIILPATVNLEQNSQVLSRISPNLVDLLIAIATGLVGGFAITRSDLAGVLPGVAIAISLVPPLSVVGVVLSEGGFQQAWGAMLLFLSNAVAMIGAGALVFTIAGYNAAARHSRRMVRQPILVVSVLSTLLVAVLAVTSLQSLAQGVSVTRIESATSTWLAGSKYSLTSVTAVPGGFIVTVIGTGDLPDTRLFYDNFTPVLWYDPQIQVRQLSGSVEPLPEPGPTPTPS